ncbi:hypothetical protein GE21DRAFT_1070207 [Neurospora crassa]|nr:hypothetical protein GE21DRAFT_1070207 [Neurospora crassa]
MSGCYMGARESSVAIIDFASCGHCIFFHHFTRIFWLWNCTLRGRKATDGTW